MARWANFFAEMRLEGLRWANFFAEMRLEGLRWANFFAEMRLEGPCGASIFADHHSWDPAKRVCCAVRLTAGPVYWLC